MRHGESCCKSCEKGGECESHCPDNPGHNPNLAAIARRSGLRKRASTKGLPRGCSGSPGVNWGIVCCTAGGGDWDPDAVSVCVIYPMPDNEGGQKPPPPHLADLPRVPPSQLYPRLFGRPTAKPPAQLFPRLFGRPTVKPPVGPTPKLYAAPATSGLGAKPVTPGNGKGIGAAPPSDPLSKECRDFCGAVQGGGTPAYWTCVFNCIKARKERSLPEGVQRIAARALRGTKMEPRKGRCPDGKLCPTRFCHCYCDMDSFGNFINCRRVIAR
jgi:hypothetical protein